MKVLSIYAIVGLATIVAQTTILSLPFFQGIFYDLLVPMVVFFRLSLPTREGATLVLIIGFVMDLFSGGQLGLYLSIYFWLLVVVKWVSNYFDIRGNMFRSILIALCVLAENLILYVISLVPGGGTPLPNCRIGPVVWQAIFAAITGPVIVAGLEKVHGRVQGLGWDNDRHRQNLTVS